MKKQARVAAHHVTLPPTGYYSPDQAVEMLGVSVHTLEKWRRAGYESVGPHHRLHGRHVLYDPRDLLEWSESREVARAVCAGPGHAARRAGREPL